MKKIYWKLLNYIFNYIRMRTWKDYDSNEDFLCGTCGKPVFKRYMFCSKKCDDKFSEKMK